MEYIFCFIVFFGFLEVLWIFAFLLVQESWHVVFFLWKAISWEATMPGFLKTLLLQTLQKSKHSGFWSFFTNESLPKSWLKKERSPFQGEEFYQIRVWSETGWALLRKTLIDPEESPKSLWEGKRRIKSYESCFKKGGSGIKEGRVLFKRRIW